MHYEVWIKNKNHRWRSINFPDRYPDYESARTATSTTGLSLEDMIDSAEGRVEFEIVEVK